MLRRKYILALIALMVGAIEVPGQQRTVIAGLEDHSEYRALLDEENSLVRAADSLSGLIATMRRNFRTDTLARAANSATIVQMEEQSFNIRSRMARLASQINTIEQEWILRHLLSGSTAGNETPDADIATERHSPNLVYSSYFEAGLSPQQLSELRAAQESEGGIPRILSQYRRNHERIEELATEYELATTQNLADSIRTEFDFATTSNQTLGKLMGEKWESVFDSKSYLYNLLADKENRRGLLARLEEGMGRVREEQSRWQGTGTPAPLLDYALQKRMLTDYEIALAGELGNGAALDSLRRAVAAIPTPESLADLKPVALKERLFLDYSDITIGSSPYNASNPIPEVAVWPHGMIWRVLVGNFSSRQSPSIFRGAHPLAVHRDDEGRFRYFAGGFPTDSLAGAAVEKLRRTGFRSPSMVAWMDGVYIDPAADGTGKPYRIEISGIAELSPEVREIVAPVTYEEGGADIVRGSGMFVISPLDAASAMRLRPALEALTATHPEIEVKLTKIPD